MLFETAPPVEKHTLKKKNRKIYLQVIQLKTLQYFAQCHK